MALTTIDDRGLKTPIDLLDNEKIRFGTGNDLEILHNATNSEIKNNTGILFVRGDSLKLTSADGENYLIGTKDGSCELYHDNNLTFHTNATGTNTIGIHVDDGATHDGDVTFTGAAANAVWDKSDNALEFADNAKATFGASADLKIHHAGGTTNKIESGANTLYVAADDLQITNAAISEACLKTFADGAVELYYDNVKKLETTSGGITLLGNALPASSNTYDLGSSAKPWRDIYIQNDLYVEDNGKAVFGDGDDLQIYHNGSKSYISDTGTGSLRITSNDFRVYNAADDELQIQALENGAVDLYYDGSKQVETVAGGLHFADSKHAEFGNSGDLKIYHDGTNSNNKIQFDQQLLFRPHGSGGSYENSAAFNPNGSVDLYYDDVKKFQTESNGLRILGDSAIWFDGWQGRFDRNWDDYPSITITGSTTYGNQGEFRFHGSAGSGLYGSGSDFAIGVRTDGAFHEGSDRRRKTNIEEITGALATVKQLTGKKFNIINRQGDLDPNRGTKKQFGLIAQECEDIIPEVIAFHPNENTPNENGWCSAYGLDYGQLTPLLINAIKELSAEVETLKTEVAALKAK